MNYGDVDTVISDLSKSLGIKNKKIVSKAKEFMRRTKVKLPSGLGASEICRPTACIYLSYDHFGELDKLDLNKIIQLCGSTSKVFYIAIRLVQNILNIARHKSVQDVISNISELKSHESKLIEQTENLIELYQKKFLGGKVESQQQYLDFKNVEFTTASLYIMASQNGIDVNSFINKFLDQCKFDKIEFERITKDIIHYCYEGKPPPVIVIKPIVPIKKVLPLKINPLKRQRDEEDNKKDISNSTTTTTATNAATTISLSTSLETHNTIKSIPDNNELEKQVNEIIEMDKQGLENTLNIQQEQKEQQDQLGQQEQEQKSNNSNIVNTDGSISLEEERKVFKKRKDESYKEWRDKILDENNSKPVIHKESLKQSDIFSFFTKK